MPLAEIFVGFVNLWTEGEPAKARYHLFVKAENVLHSRHCFEFQEVLALADRSAQALQQSGFSEYVLTNGVRLDTPLYDNEPCPCDYLTLEERTQVEEVIGKYLRKVDR